MESGTYKKNNMNQSAKMIDMFEGRAQAKKDVENLGYFSLCP